MRPSLASMDKLLLVALTVELQVSVVDLVALQVAPVLVVARFTSPTYVLTRC